MKYTTYRFDCSTISNIFLTNAFVLSFINSCNSFKQSFSTVFRALCLDNNAITYSVKTGGSASELSKIEKKHVVKTKT